MRKVSLFTAVLFLSAAWALAQTTPSSSSSSSAQAGTSTSSNETMIEGCLSGSAGSYTLTDSSGKIYQLQGDTSKLSDEVGHQVRVHGSEASSASGTTGNAGSSAGNSAAGTSGGTNFNVTSVKKVADTCSNK